MEQPVCRRVVGVGAANIDILGQSRANIVMRDSNPGYLATSVGGVTRNVLENLARQGVDAALLAAVGGDVFGEKIVSDSARAGIDTTRMLRSGAASSGYIAVLDERGDMLLGLSDMRVISAVTPAYLDENAALLQTAAAVVCDACLTAETLEHLAGSAAGNTAVFVDPVSTAYARKLKPLVGMFAAVKPNEMELSILSGLPVENETQIERAAEALLSRGVRCVAVSRGGKGCYYADADGTRMFRSLRPVSDMVNATGAGDAFLAGLVHGYIDGLEPAETIDYALASGLTAILSMSTIHPDMSDALVKKHLAAYRR